MSKNKRISNLSCDWINNKRENKDKTVQREVVQMRESQEPSSCERIKRSVCKKIKFEWV
jgi:hypothetical protein